VAPHYDRLSTQDVNNLWADATESPMLVPDLDTRGSGNAEQLGGTERGAVFGGGGVMIQTHSRVGLVLGAGGVLGGAWQAGALQALKLQTGWDPRDAECFVGTSVGSLMAALLAAGILPNMDLVEAAAHHMAGFPWPIPGSWDLGFSSAKARGRRNWIMTVAGLLPRGLLSTQPIQESVKHRIPGGWPAHRRLWITATDYRTGERVVFGRASAPEADLAAAVAASCAIPGVYRPVEIGGRQYVDGGLHSATNLDLLSGLRLDVAICLNPMSSSSVAPGPRSLADRLQAVAEHAAHRSLMSEAGALRASGTPVVLIEPGPEDLVAIGLNLMSRKRTHLVFETAVRTVAHRLAAAQPIPA
jgi:NTE family protein